MHCIFLLVVQPHSHVDRGSRLLVALATAQFKFQREGVPIHFRSSWRRSRKISLKNFWGNTSELMIREWPPTCSAFLLLSAPSARRGLSRSPSSPHGSSKRAMRRPCRNASPRAWCCQKEWRRGHRDRRRIAMADRQRCGRRTVRLEA